uniref:Uncharacterized protein n=1 Tax=Graphocephala atropunctata TaxID=36148 RepID=A0A1B6MB25_9HEMI
MYSAILKLTTCNRPAKIGIIDVEFFQVYFPCFCSTHVFSLQSYVTVLGLLGVLVTSLQIYHVVTDKVLHVHIAKPTPPSLNNVLVRDLKLILTVIELIVYFSLLLGGYWRMRSFLDPWLLLKSFLVVVTAMLGSWRFILQKPMTLSTLGLISFLVELHNFLYVLCLSDDIFRELKKD